MKKDANGLLFHEALEQLEAEEIAHALDAFAQEEGEFLQIENEHLTRMGVFKPSRNCKRKLHRILKKPDNPTRRQFSMLAAALLVVMLTINISAIRACVGNFILSFGENSVAFSDSKTPPPDYIDLTQTPIPQWLPDGYACSKQVKLEGVIKLFYVHADSSEIRFCSYEDSTTLEIDNDQNSGSYQEITINGQRGHRFLEHSKLTLMWGKAPAFIIIGPSTMQAELLRMAESVGIPPEQSGES